MIASRSEVLGNDTDIWEEYGEECALLGSATVCLLRLRGVCEISRTAGQARGKSPEEAERHPGDLGKQLGVSMNIGHVRGTAVRAVGTVGKS